MAHRAGVTYATTSFLKPAAFSRGAFIGGLSATFRTGANHGMERAAIIKSATALHIAIGRSLPFAPSPGPSVSTQVATLRRLLLNGEGEHTETGKWFKKAANGEIPLVIDVSSADIMATLIALKSEAELGSILTCTSTTTYGPHIARRERKQERWHYEHHRTDYTDAVYTNYTMLYK